MYALSSNIYNSMMFLIQGVVFASLVLSASSQISGNKQDVIGFPESEENPDLKNKDNRSPVFLPSMCPNNELYYPGDQKDDWICDCRPSYLYHPTSDACWPANRRGPCEQGQYLVLKSNSVIPVCEKNPCIDDGLVSWNGKCEKLGATSPCDFLYPVPAVLGVNATTLMVNCVKLEVPNRLSEIRVPTGCPPGTKRSISGKCVTSSRK